MAVIQDLILYPINTTTVDTGAGIDVRLLSNAQPGADDTSQTAQFTNANDNVERTFDPATAAVTNTNNAGTTLFKAGWALRLANDMTPANDTNYDAFLPAQTIAVSLVMTANQTGGTYASGTLTPTFRASLWRYNPATDTATLIAAGSSNATSWNVAGVGGDLGTAKTVTFNIVVANSVFGAAKGTAAEIFYLQVGFNTGTVPDPTLGTGTFTMTFTVDNTNTKLTMPIGLAELGYMVGTASGVGAATGAGAPVYPTTGSASGAATAAGVLLAYKLVTGTAIGSAAVSGAFGAVKLGTGSASGIGAATGATSIVKPTVGSVDIGGAGGSTVIRRPVLIFDH